jgi:hypothetical protein
VRESRKNFERIPDKGISNAFPTLTHRNKIIQSFKPFEGLISKSIQRVFNRIWNYGFKGLVGTVAVCAVFPVLCLGISTVSLVAGVLSPIWYVVHLSYFITQVFVGPNAQYQFFRDDFESQVSDKPGHRGTQ